jgi:hypothetical protein
VLSPSPNGRMPRKAGENQSGVFTTNISGSSLVRINADKGEC